VNKSQFASFNSSSTVKVQDVQTKDQQNVNKEISTTSVTQPLYRNKVTNELTVKPQVVQSLLLQSSSIVKNQSGFTNAIQIPSGVKGIAFSQTVSAPNQVQRVVSSSSSPKLMSKMQSAKPIPIRPKVDTSKVVTQQQIVVSPPPQLKQTLIPISPTPVTARFNVITQKWTGVPALYQQPVPALTYIQPKLVPIVQQRVETQRIDQEDEKEDEQNISEVHEKTPHRSKQTSEELRLAAEVKRIIEGDPEVEEQSRDSELVEPIEGFDTSDDESKDEKTTIPEAIEPQAALLLCDERIESVSTEPSPLESEKSKASSETPKESDSDNQKVVTPRPSVLGVRKNLSRELSSLECDKENVEMVIEEESDSDESSVVESQRQKMLDYEDSLAKTEIAKDGHEFSITPPVPTTTSSKNKRVRKPKNPTIIATLGLPYKPSQPTTRKTKVEKKLEFELDFHDPLNKIQWDDGIGGLNNCNKLFGFDEFGLIEVINKKDAIAKLKLFDTIDVKKEDESTYNLRKIVDPADQFVCAVCSKMGTIRNFYSPECCSESCMGITKRKANELSLPGGKESSPESEIVTPVDERKLMFGGELIPLQQLQQHLLEQELPPTKRKRSRKQNFPTTQESKFMWDTYLSSKSVPAPIELFKNPFPRLPNPFRVGMKLEAIDPENQKLFCVCSVEEKLGYRIKLHFDGYPPLYDFWVNADSPNIFPSGFCFSSNRELQTPAKWSSKKFDWSEYLDHTNSTGTPRSLFPHLSKQIQDHQFEVGMKLEVMRDGKLYAASIIDVLGDRLLVSHDGHEELGCIWLDIKSPYLHPCNYHRTIEDPEIFIPPSRPFEWKDYLKATASKEAPAEYLFFRRRLPYDFVPGLKLEVVDKANRQLVRPATVLSRNEYKVQIIFDGFDLAFAYWLDDDSEDLHPINWCEKTGHPIEHPAGFNRSQDNTLCPSPGCRGIGNGPFPDRYFHDNPKECPYSKVNWKKLLNKQLGSHIDAKINSKR
jgi:mbt repeat